MELVSQLVIALRFENSLSDFSSVTLTAINPDIPYSNDDIDLQKGGELRLFADAIRYATDIAMK